MKRFDFKDGIDFDQFFYCYSPQAKCCGVFEREDDCIKNSYNAAVGDYEYTTLMLREKLGVGARIVTECDFEKRGAPLIVISDVIFEKGGNPYYGEHFEAVAFEEGCNVWHNKLATDPNAPRPLVVEKIHFEDIPTANKSRVKLAVEFGDGAMTVEMNGRRFTVKDDAMPREFWFGITACEGINRFYNLTVE